ncbi:MAG: hypothetical protein Q4E18_02665 [Clostridia bacterium]|nr:hypothetical protein [Clostridia bacterium]
MGVASLILGIISLICGIFLAGFQWVGIIVGIIGIILGALGRKDPQKKGIATGGLVCAIIGTVFSSITFIACAVCVGGVGALGALS